MIDELEKLYYLAEVRSHELMEKFADLKESAIKKELGEHQNSNFLQCLILGSFLAKILFTLGAYNKLHGESFNIKDHLSVIMKNAELIMDQTSEEVLNKLNNAAKEFK